MKCEYCGKRLYFRKNALDYLTKHHLAIVMSKWIGKTVRRMNLDKFNIKYSECKCERICWILLPEKEHWK